LQLAKEELGKAGQLSKDEKNEEATQMGKPRARRCRAGDRADAQHQANADARSAEEQLRAVQDNRAQ